MTPVRRFKLRVNNRNPAVTWLNRHTVFEGELLSRTGRMVRLYAPHPMAQRQHVDLPYDWVTPVG